MAIVSATKRSSHIIGERYPHIGQLVASYRVGKLTKDKQLCKILFPCISAIKSDDATKIQVNHIPFLRVMTYILAKFNKEHNNLVLFGFYTLL